MSLLDDVSIVVTPNGYKAGELYSVVPSNGDADMDVTRATAATRVDEDGLVNYAEIVSDTELITNGDFSNGTTDWEAEGFSSMDVGTYQGRNNVLNVNILNTSTISRIRQPFDYVSGVTYLINVDVYLVSGSFRVDSSDSFVLGNFVSTNTTGSWQTLTAYITASGTGSNYIWLRSSSQISQFYISNVSVKEVTRDNVPRIDYTGGGCPHILAEPQRTNLITYSEDFTQWSSKINIDVTLNSETSPDGVVNATFINENNSNAQHFIGQSLSITNGQDISISVYAKKNQRDVLQISPSGNYLSTSGYANYDLNNGLVTASGGGVTAEIEGLTNGWFRCVAKFTANNTASGTTAFFLQNSTTASRGSSYDGDGTSGLYMWGAQTEIGSYPTSYIPNFGTLLGVTRNQDIFTRDGIGSLINSTEGVLFVEMAALSDDGTFRSISLSNGTPTNRVTVRYNTTSNIISAFVYQGSSTIFSYNNIVTDVKDFHKLAIKYKSGDLAFWVDGVEVATSTTSFTFLPLTELDFDRGGGDRFFFGKVKQLQVYKTALTDEQLTSLTT